MTASREKGLKQLTDGRWQWSYMDPNGRYHRRIARTKTEARAYLEKVRTEIREGRYLERRSTPRVAIEEAVKQFLKWGETNLAGSTKLRDEHFSALWLAFPKFKGRPLSEIAVTDVEAYRAHRLATVGKRTCDYDLSRLRRLFVLSESWGLSKGNPAKGVKFFNPDNRRDRFLTREEEESLVAEVPDWVRPAIRFSVNTGLRQGELVSLVWGQVDLGLKVVTVTAEKAKGKKLRRIPLNKAAIKAIGTQPRAIAPETPVFPQVAEYGTETLRQAFRRAAKRLKMDERAISWHTLRHTFASRLVQAGVSLLTVKELLGHSTLVMVMRYAHLADENLRAAVDALESPPDLQKTCNRPSKRARGGKA